LRRSANIILVLIGSLAALQWFNGYDRRYSTTQPSSGSSYYRGYGHSYGGGYGWSSHTSRGGFGSTGHAAGS